MAGKPIIIGWKEYISFPAWNIHRVKAKIDTGARTSALDVTSYELREVPGQGLMAELRLALNRRHPEQLTIVHTPVLKMVSVRNTSGLEEQRPLLETELRLGPIVKPVQLTVTNRAGMLFRMILGRKALEGDFVVDVSRKYLLRKK
ncbi:MAG: ATP-dependent zinc protease [Planctomycetes bacterium]|nr:ATP-dependent zinc protease [Planctomycetota bacterium]